MLNDIIKKVLSEATSDSGGSRGSYVTPLRPGLREFNKPQLSPFNIPVSKYDSPLLGYDSYDGKMDETKKQIKKIEKVADKSTKYLKKHPIQNDDDGDVINPTPGKGKKMVPIKEDLAVWFGTKKKPKGSKQPKGPWVDICRKVNGKHPPCGRSDSDSGSYPKCRAAGVAGKMSDSAKKAACQQKRRAEKKDTQTGKGQKPIMTSYKPRKKTTNENMKTIRLTESDLVRIVKRIIKESDQLPTGRLDLMCTNYNSGEQRGFYDMVANGQLSDTPRGKGFSIKKNPESMIPSDVVGGSSSGNQYLTIEQPTDVLMEYFKKRFPNIDFDKTQLKNILYIKNLSGGQGFCRTSESTDQEWLDFFDRNNVSYKIV